MAPGTVIAAKVACELGAAGEVTDTMSSARSATVGGAMVGEGVVVGAGVIVATAVGEGHIVAVGFRVIGIGNGGAVAPSIGLNGVELGGDNCVACGDVGRAGNDIPVGVARDCMDCIGASVAVAAIPGVRVGRPAFFGVVVSEPAVGVLTGLEIGGTNGVFGGSGVVQADVINMAVSR